jgi:hypothetical protein
MTSVRTPLLVLAIEGVLLAGVFVHAHAREAKRQSEQPAIDALARFLPAADLSLAGAARHLRFPSLEEPGAAFSDAPASPDLDPAGGALAPPTDVYAANADPRPLLRPPRPTGRAGEK